MRPSQQAPVRAHEPHCTPRSSLHDTCMTACGKCMAVLIIWRCFAADFRFMCGASKEENRLEFWKMHRSRLTALAMDHVVTSRLTGRATANGEGMRRPPHSIMKSLGIDTPFMMRAR
ncbi:hypothetical protein E3C22_07805 [Jiella endophytica]|uniref:Uncharacterized protein n=1 Tax=Jiella endophytica TaxID=2558362 RepID=A0A4Y8RNT0_9HYPH|nr:hypothetical protein [Jiella endophytica]TFF25268.1 hypothetical protein E3C22_07805 [Jiella endophytica]